MVIHLKLFGLTAISKLVAHQTACAVVANTFASLFDECIALASIAVTIERFHTVNADTIGGSEQSFERSAVSLKSRRC